MAQAQLNTIKLDKLDTPYNPKFSPPQSQDAFGLELGHYDHRSQGSMDRDSGCLRLRIGYRKTDLYQVTMSIDHIKRIHLHSWYTLPCIRHHEN